MKPTLHRRSLLLRSIAYLVIWMIMTGGGLANLGAGLFAAPLAAWVSVALMPPDPGPVALRPWALMRLFLRFVWGSIVAGVDVARRAFSPSMPLDPGWVAYPSRLPPCAARNLFMSVTSLMPGTLPAGIDASGALVYHCLDVRQPVLEELAAEEALLLDALGGALGSRAALEARAGSADDPA